MHHLLLYPVNNDDFSVQVPVLCLTTVLFTAGCLDDSVSESHVPAATHLVMEHLRKTAGEQVYQLRDFALLLDGFPPDAVDEQEIASFVCTSLLVNQPPESVVKVVIGFDTKHYDEHVKLSESLKERLDTLKDRNECLTRLHTWRSIPAPHPEDIVWENLSFSRAKRVLVQALLWVVALGLCTASFCIAAMLIILNISLKNKDFTGTGIGVIKPVEDLIMSINGNAIQEALNDPVGLILANYVLPFENQLAVKPNYI
ncbi:GTP-binding protein TypA, related, related [Eimeria tenella]|uniref:GTP-binding protein TypA, related, related n=1 Tax=Eimeria tenella TaxID=5802 RepID=U6KUW7_EIMTE|nr:GTP-binding protein TypA, related, related [Eimeria tenella]CDJ40154.1 GTP-binding protein TypA, related, related [Eimeria tenella]|eukprot:XP_013230907.1 GTP-binding protein TypA, related, related [Eimeria tenella]